jgi:adenylate cyclase
MGKRLLYGFLLVVLAYSATEIATQARWLEGLEQAHYDLWQQLAGQRYQPQHVVIVTIDDQTSREHADEPLVFWAPHFARVLEVLNHVGARVVGVDFLFSVSAEAWLKKLDLPSGRSRTYDLALRQQLAAGKVILAGNLLLEERGKSETLLPIPEYYFSLPRRLDDVGLTNFYNDPDGVIRRFPTILPDSEGDTWPTFGALLADRARDGKPSLTSQLKRIGFAGPPATFPRLAFRRLLRPQAAMDPEIQALRDKVVIIGLETRLQDIHLTPYAKGIFGFGPLMMRGPELHANIVETLLTGRSPRPIPGYLRSALLIVWLAAGTWLFFHLSPWQGMGKGIALILCGLALSYVFFLSYRILPVASLEVGLTLCYLGTLGVRLTAEERTRVRLRQLFGRYVADEVVENFMVSGQLPDLGGEELRVTILFADIRNFTTIAERLTPHEVVEMLNTYFSSICEPILQYGGTVDKFIGDAVMAVFGAPAPHPDHARRALCTALSMSAKAQEFRDWMARRFPDKGLPEFHIGIGLHTGQAVVGNIGSPQRLEYTSIGDTVNLASRLEGLTKELGWPVVASGATIAAAGTGVITGRRQEMQVKGHQALVEVYEVLGVEPGMTNY